MKNTTNITPIPGMIDALTLSGDMPKNWAIKRDSIGSVNYAIWTFEIKGLQMAVYDLEKYESDYAITDPSRNVLPYNEDWYQYLKDAVYTQARVIMDLIGPINGHKFRDTNKVVSIARKYATVLKDEWHGDALLTESQLRNVKSELELLDKFPNGVREGYREEREVLKATLEEKLKEFRSVPGMRYPQPAATPAATFRKNLEHELALLVTNRKMKSWEELEVEKEIKRRERRARTAEKRAKK